MNKLLIKNKKTVEKLAEELLHRETLTGEEIMEIVSGKKKSGVKKTSKNKAVKKSKKA